MSSLNLPPSARLLDKSILSWIETTFRRIQDTLDVSPNFAYGNTLITGSAEIDTGLIYVDMCVASLIDDPESGAAFVSAVPVNVAEVRKTDYGNILVSVFSDSYAASAIEKEIGWMAIGTTRIR